jgi:hypothetical protein
LGIASSLKEDVASAVETLNSNVKAENVKLAADLTSNLTSQLTSKFRAENLKLAEEVTAKFRGGSTNLREELSQRIQDDVTNMSQAFSALRNDTDKELQRFRETGEGKKSDLHKVHLEINNLKAQFAAGTAVTGRSAGYNAGEFQAPGDRNDQRDLKPLAQTNLSETSSLRIVNDVSDENCNMHCASGLRATQTPVTDLSQKT